jgi:hypothetical protein
MTNFHNYSFFGKATGLIFQSSQKFDPYVFIRCIKKKGENNWEKPSKGEGKAIKLNLEEIVMVLNVLLGKVQNWSSYHKYKGESTQISFNWEKTQENVISHKLWINIGEYAKMLNFAQVEIFKNLLQHVFKEKIEYSTASNNLSNQKSKKSEMKKIYSDKKGSSGKGLQNNQPDTLIIKEEEIVYKNPKDSRENKLIEGKGSKGDKKSTEIRGEIKAETNKALLVLFQHGKESWIPKSVVHSKYNTTTEKKQTFNIDNWILRKNGIIS